MIYRRAKQAGIATQIGCHTFRATGITIYLTNGGTLEKAQMMAAHSSPRTTKLYDRTNDAVSLDEVEAHDPREKARLGSPGSAPGTPGSRSSGPRLASSRQARKGEAMHESFWQCYY